MFLAAITPKYAADFHSLLLGSIILQIYLSNLEKILHKNFRKLFRLYTDSEFENFLATKNFELIFSEIKHEFNLEAALAAPPSESL
jgi:hypothetical protein